MGNIRIIGPRSSGKTTYLSALASFGKKGKMFTVIPINEDSRRLLDHAENKLKQGERLEGTNKININDLPDYLFVIEGKKGFRNYRIDLNAKDYPGEIFDTLAQTEELDQDLQDYIEHCLMNDVIGCLIFLTAWEKGADRTYQKALEHFIRLMDNWQRSNNLRLAVVMSKCERGEIWPGRVEPEIDLFDVHLPNTKELLQEKILPQNLRFFALSAFGVLGKNDPRPNRIDEIGKEGKHSVLRDPDSWQPYNLIEPLYWLSKGQ